MPPSQNQNRDRSQKLLSSQFGAADLESIILLPIEEPSKDPLVRNFPKLSSKSLLERFNDAISNSEAAVP